MKKHKKFLGVVKEEELIFHWAEWKKKLTARATIDSDVNDETSGKEWNFHLESMIVEAGKYKDIHKCYALVLHNKMMEKWDDLIKDERKKNTKYAR